MDMLAACAYALGNVSGAALLTVEFRNEYVRFRAWQSCLLFTPLMVGREGGDGGEKGVGSQSLTHSLTITTIDTTPDATTTTPPETDTPPTTPDTPSYYSLVIPLLKLIRYYA